MMFKDHADAMRVIGATFAGHALLEQPSQSWMVRRMKVPETGEALPPATTDVVASSAYHFVVTWLPGRALIITGDIGSSVYSGITHLASLEATVRLVREADMDYLSRKSTHKKEFDFDATARAFVSRAYDGLRRQKNSLDMDAIVDWADLVFEDDRGPKDRKAACRALLDADMSESDVWQNLYDAQPDICMSWPAAAHWHYEALRTWANLMTRDSVQNKIQAAAARSEETA